MAEAASCPDSTRLQALLGGTLEKDVEAALTDHIENCEQCQATLDDLSGRSWADKGKKLREEAPTLAPAPVAEESADKTEVDGKEELTFLGTPRQVGHLGRLGHYEVLKQVGAGGMGIVLKAFDEKLHRMVAIKVMALELAASGTARQRFVREARAAAAVAHEHVVAIHAIEEEHRPPYIVMQFIEGQSLQEKIDKEGPLGLREILRIGLQTAEGLAAAHKHGLVHRDIKPANILLENGVERVQITDFGLARAVDDASLTQSGVIAGTPAYMSPEQANGVPLDHRSDLFSLGSVLYVMCTGRLPFRAASNLAVLLRVVEETPRPIRETNNDIPAWLEAIVVKLHAKKPEERFQTAREVAELLGAKLADVQTGRAVSVSDRSAAAPTDVSPPVAHAHGSPKSRRFPVIAAMLAIAAAVALAVFWPRGDNSPLVPIVNPPIVPDADKDGWAQLFNGKDLDGWKTHPDQPGDWKVEDGILVGRAPEKPNHLFSERGDFENFHFRVEAKLNDVGNSGQNFRCEYGLNDSLLGPVGPAKGPLGYEANISFPDVFKTGTLWGASWPPVGPKESLIPPDTWFTQEVIALGSRIVIKVNGKTTVDFIDPLFRYRRGHLALQAWAVGTVVHFKKIEIKELPATPPPTVTDVLKDAALVMNFEKDTFYQKDGKTYVRDLSGKGNDGLCVDVEYTPDGKAGGGLLCKGGRLRLGKSLIEGRANYTIAAWCRCNNTDPSLTGFYVTRAAADLNGVLFAIYLPLEASVHVNAWNLAHKPDNWLVANTDADLVPKGPWFFLAVTLEGGGASKGKVRVTIDDKVVTLPSQMVDSRDPKSDVIAHMKGIVDIIGHMKGAVIDELAVFQRSLSREEIALLRSEGMIGRPLSLKAKTTPDVQPFVVLDGKNKKEYKFPTLAEAVATAVSGDTIEIRGDGPFITEPLDLQAKDLVIRSARGFRPVLNQKPETITATGPMFHTSGVLVLEGLDLHRTGSLHEGWLSATVASYGSSLYVANCRFLSLVNPKGQMIILAQSSDRCEIRNSLFIAGNNVSLGGIDCMNRRQVSLENNLSVTPGAGFSFAIDPDPKGGDVPIRIERSTFVHGLTMVLVDEQSLMKFKDKEYPRLRFDLKENIVDPRHNDWPSFLSFHQSQGLSKPEAKDLVPEKAEELLQARATWSEQKNLFAEGAPALGLLSRWQGLRPAKERSGLTGWNEFWKLKDTGSIEGQPRYQGGDLLAKAKTEPEKMIPADFRLVKGGPGQGVLPGGKDLGADVDLVGPGAAYERWQQKPEYQAWAEKTRKLLAGN